MAQHATTLPGSAAKTLPACICTVLSVAAQQRFINLIDVLYDQDKHLVLLGRCSLRENLSGDAIDLARTRSRLGPLVEVREAQVKIKRSQPSGEMQSPAGAVEGCDLFRASTVPSRYHVARALLSDQ